MLSWARRLLKSWKSEELVDYAGEMIPKSLYYRRIISYLEGAVTVYGLAANNPQALAQQDGETVIVQFDAQGSLRAAGKLLVQMKQEQSEYEAGRKR